MKQTNKLVLFPEMKSKETQHWELGELTNIQALH